MADQPTRRPVSVLTTIQRGAMLADDLMAQKRIETADPERQWGLGIASVTEVDYEEMFISLRVIVGASSDDERVPVPITFPGAGARHFFGAMPEIGDLCVVGWMPQESLRPNAARTPVILGWVLPGVWTGRDWMTTSAFGVDEADMGSQRERDVARAVFDRVRHKLRHIQPGNIVASSSQGSDLVLDEGVLLANRRGNEFRLRDQDQAAVLRALQRFEALAGIRGYHGMVQRDATFLPAAMVSDGKLWDGKQQAVDGKPLSQTDLPDDPSRPRDFLAPADTLSKILNSEEEGPFLKDPLYQWTESLDPYTFLQRGGFLTEDGFVIDGSHRADAVYGGKAIFRVAAPDRKNAGKNATLDAKIPTLTERRIEIAHTSDGRLPVTEQTDGFDADRLPPTDKETPGGSPSAPFIEWVMGSVIGNDPYTAKGRLAYGLPLIAKVFDGDTVVPRLDPVPLTVSDKSDTAPAPLKLHAASLFKLNPLDGTPATFWSVNKQGQLRAFISGPRRENSAEVALSGGLKLALGGPLTILMDGGINFGTKSKESLHLHSEQGPVTVYGGGPVKAAEAVGERLAGTKRGESDLPSVDIHGRTGVRVRSGTKVFLKGAIVESNATSQRMQAHSDMEIGSGGRLGVSAETLAFLCSGRRTDEFSGPKNFSPTQGPLHERTYTPSVPGLVCEKATYTWGDREETLKLGNHTTTVIVGDATYEVGVGTLTLRGATSQFKLNLDGIEGIAAVGDVTLDASTGAASMTAVSSVRVAASAGDATLSGGTRVLLSAPVQGPDFGPIVCGGSLEPFTGLPFSTWGIGAPNHLVTP